MAQKNSLRSPLIWLGIAFLLIVACAIMAFLEETTFMRVLAWVGVGFGVICAGFSVAELLSALRNRRE